jgi:hypothetical protein
MKLVELSGTIRKDIRKRKLMSLKQTVGTEISETYIQA